MANYKREKGIDFTICAILFFLLSGSIASGVFAETESYQNYRIQDLPWVDDKEIALYLNSGATTNKWGRNYDSLFNANMSDAKYKRTDANINLQSQFELKEKTLAYELLMELPIEITYSLLQNEQHFFELDIFNESTSNSNYKDESINIDFNPDIYYIKYFNGYFAGWDTQVLLTRNKHTNDSKNEKFNGTYNYNYSMFNENYRVGISEVISLGQGRIYEGNYAYQAMQIAEDLNNTKHLLKAISENDIKALSEIVAKDRMQYYLDSRLQIMSAVEKISVFLISNQYVAMNDIRGLLIIEDSYRNSFLNSRKYGLKYNLRLGGEYNYFGDYLSTQLQYSFPDKQKEKNYSYFAGAEIAWNYPINQKWQFDLLGKTDFVKDYDWTERYYSYNNYTTTQESITPRSCKTQINSELSYYYNSRWMCSLDYYLLVDIRSEEENWELENNLTSINDNLNDSHIMYWIVHSLTVSTSYNLNYNLDLTLSLELTQRYSDTKDHKLTGNNKYSLNNRIQTMNQLLNSYPSENELYWTGSIALKYRLF